MIRRRTSRNRRELCCRSEGQIAATRQGYALRLLVEALTSGLTGHGRANPGEGWPACVDVQAIDPALFGGADDFRRQTEWMAGLCRENPPRPGFDRVRLPGEAGLHRREEQLRNGGVLYPTILPALAPWARKLGVTTPMALG